MVRAPQTIGRPPGWNTRIDVDPLQVELALVDVAHRALDAERAVDDSRRRAPCARRAARRCARRCRHTWPDGGTRRLRVPSAGGTTQPRVVERGVPACRVEPVALDPDAGRPEQLEPDLRVEDREAVHQLLAVPDHVELHGRVLAVGCGHEAHVVHGLEHRQRVRIVSRRELLGMVVGATGQRNGVAAAVRLIERRQRGGGGHRRGRHNRRVRILRDYVREVARAHRVHAQVVVRRGGASGRDLELELDGVEPKPSRGCTAP